MNNQEEVIKKCYETCPGKDSECELYLEAELYLKGKSCVVYRTMINDIRKLHLDKTNITYSTLIDIIEARPDIQLHIDNQGMKCNTELMFKAFKQQYKNRFKDEIILKDEQTYINNNVWDCVDAKTKVIGMYKMLHRGDW